MTEDVRSPEAIQHFSKLVVLGVKPDAEEDGSLKLTQRGRLNLQAAAALYKAGRMDTIVVSGGKTHGPDKPAESELMKEHLVTKCDIPENVIEEENESKTTTDNLKNVSVATQGEKIAILSDVEHLKRVAILLEKNGLQATLIDTESSLREHGSRHIVRFLEKYERSPKYQVQRAKETLNRLILVVDKNDYVHKLYAQLTRGGSS